MDILSKLREMNKAPFNRQVMLSILKNYKRPNDKISEMVKRGELTTIKKGLYIPGAKSGLPSIEPFLLANHLWGPSYVSLESAMSFWNLIPEKVFETTSITTRNAKKYKTSEGRFSYLRLPLPYYSFGLKSVELSTGQVAIIASQEKAICDKIITTPNLTLRSVSQTLSYLVDDLRIDNESLRKLNKKTINSWAADAPKQSSIRMLIKTLDKL